jgi:hypothetical protein
MTADILSWWALLCSVSVMNVFAWLVSTAALQRRRSVFTAEVFAARRLQVVLCAGYVFGCAFRSVLPVYDVPRIGIVDSWLSNVLIGRSVATIAELCFVGQWALLLREAALGASNTFSRRAAAVLVPLIVVAETCSWYSVLTTSNLGHVVEEALWALSAALLVVSLASIWPRSSASLRRLLSVWCTAGVAYVGFMFLFDVPMYWSRWLADEAGGRRYLSITQGVIDASQPALVSHRWDDWKSEVVWMSLYFSVAVWLSLGLVHAPPLDPRLAPPQEGRKPERREPAADNVPSRPIAGRA